MHAIDNNTKNVLGVAWNNNSDTLIYDFSDLIKGSKNVDTYKKERFKNFIITLWPHGFNITDNNRIKDTYAKYL